MLKSVLLLQFGDVVAAAAAAAAIEFVFKPCLAQKYKMKIEIVSFVGS